MLLVEDRQLLDAFRAGRPEALKTVYAHYHPRLSQLLRAGFSFRSGDRWLRFRGYASPFDREQAVNEALGRAFLPAARLAYDGVHPFGDYLFGIARNQVLNELRRTDLLVPLGDDEIDEAAGPAGMTAPRELEPTLEEREVRRLLDAFLAGSSPVERRLYHLRFDEEKGQEEAARAMGLSRIRLRRVEYALKKRLLGYLKKHGYLSDVPRSILGQGLGRGAGKSAAAVLLMLLRGYLS